MNLRISLSRRVQVIGVGVAVAVVLAAGLLVASSAGPDVELSAPRYVADPVPKPKAIAKGDMPARCGVRTATAHRYVPGGTYDGIPGSCRWRSFGKQTKCFIADGERGLFVILDSAPRSTYGAALSEMNPAVPGLVATGNPERPVSGLGAEALYRYTPTRTALDATYRYSRREHFADSGIDPGAVLRFRVGANVVTINYDGNDCTKNGSVQAVPEKRARPAVFAVAAEVARALHAPAKPVLGPASVGPAPPTAHPVRPCDLVPDDLASHLAPGARAYRPESVGENIAVLPEYGEAVDSCRWDAKVPVEDGASGRAQRHLSVTVFAETNWRPGSAVREATRQYRVLYADAREGGQGFHAVRGLGDQAYSTLRTYAYETTFRHGGMLVVVRYVGDDLNPTEQINGAYTAAVRAEEALR